jgi:hypothetical protein
LGGLMGANGIRIQRESQMAQDERELRDIIV